MDSVLVWLPDSEAAFCSLCSTVFGFFKRKHHCRKCGKVCCNNCTPFRMKVPEHGFTSKVRVCTKCCYDSLQPPKFTVGPGTPEILQQTLSSPPSLAIDSSLSDFEHLPESLSQQRHKSLHYPSRRTRSSFIPSQTPQTSHKSQSFLVHAPRSDPPFNKVPAPPSMSKFSIHASPSSPPAPQFVVPANWSDLEPMHFGPVLAFPVQYQIPSGSKMVELPDGCSLNRGLNGFTLSRPNVPAVPLGIFRQYVPAYMLGSGVADIGTTIIKTGPTLCMPPGQQNWARGMLRVDGVMLTWHGRDGEVLEFSLSPSVILAPVDRGGQVKGVVSKADGILGIAERNHVSDPSNSSQSPRTIWYFHFPSKDVRNNWYFSLTYNIAHSLSKDSHFQQVRTEFMHICGGLGVKNTESLDWRGILDILYGDI